MINRIYLLILLTIFYSHSTIASVAREWNDALLDAIRTDQARPTVHARNLYHVSAAMWDAWASYDSISEGVFYKSKHDSALWQRVCF